MTSLLTPQQVADLLQISVRTVYDHARDLGGFYPAGLRVLRFNPGVIYGYMEGQGKGSLAISVRVPRGGDNRARVQYATGGRSSKRIAPEGNQGKIKTDPARHGL